MRILWIGKPVTGEDNGVEVFDRKTIGACRALGQEVDVFYPSQVSRPREVVNLVSGLPYYRARFASGSNVRDIQRISSDYDVAICSWEPYDALARRPAIPTIMILHNVTSRALPELFPSNPLAAIGAAHLRVWENRWYRSGSFAVVAALSRRDYDYLEQLEGAPNVLLLPPGMPPCVELSQTATFKNEIVISGTFEWAPKRRDLFKFASEYAALDRQMLVRADALPLKAAQCLGVSTLPSTDETRSGMRIGLITDRFEAGHKFKTLAYVANNQIVLSFADVDFDFAHVPDHEFFIRRINSSAEIDTHASALSALCPIMLRERFRTFKRACAEYFTWNGVATLLLEAAQRACQHRRHGYAAGRPSAGFDNAPASGHDTNNGMYPEVVGSVVAPAQRP